MNDPAASTSHEVRDNPVSNCAELPWLCRTSVRTLLFFLVVFFCASVLSDYAAQYFSLSNLQEAGLKAVLLCVLFGPIFYFCHLQPLASQIQKNRTTNAELQDTAMRMEKVVDIAFDGIIVINGKGIIEQMNPAAERIFLCQEKEAIGSNISSFVPEPDRSRHDDYIANYLGTGQRKIIGIDRELKGLRKNGEAFSMELAVTEMEIHGERKFVGTVRDISRRHKAEESLKQANEQLEKRVLQRTLELSREIEERIKAEEKLQELATTDSLTKVYNRREFDRLFSIELERARRYQLPLSIIMFDIDHFKKINDNYGHMIGDRVIVDIAQLVMDGIRKSDVLARWGGEEFILLVPGVDKKGAHALAEKLRVQIEQCSFPEVGSVSCSFGIASNENATTADELMKAVDHSLYKAKQNGRNRVEMA